MSTTYLAEIYVSDRAACAAEAIDALRRAARTPNFHAFALTYAGAGDVATEPLSLLVRQEVGLVSPHGGRPRGLAQAMHRAVRRVVGPGSTIHVRVVDLDRADWTVFER